jgi:hypothetical protein
LNRGKKSSQALPDVWGGVKKHSKQPNSSFTVSITKSPPGSLRNPPKAFSKRPTLKKIRSQISFTFYENSQEHIAAEI